VAQNSWKKLSIPQKELNMENSNEMLSTRQQKIALISAFTAKWDVENLKTALNEGLNAGLTINEINEELAHLYAYCGFAPSIRGINTFRDVVREREAKGIKDEKGREPSAVDESINKYERGEKAQMLVTALSAEQLKELFAFNPLIDVFLKEHLFADIFDRDILSYIDREIVTVSSLASLHDPFVRSHIGGALNVGVSEQQLRELFSIIENIVGKKEADTARQVLDEVLATRKNS
jgi:alkylhydroperoxidase/carboxymuconolactone decarboxylase family protein YurZ